MTPLEWMDWQTADYGYRNQRGTRKRVNRSGRPCAECPAAWAAEQRLHGRCNGVPNGDDNDEDG